MPRAPVCQSRTRRSRRGAPVAALALRACLDTALALRPFPVGELARSVSSGVVAVRALIVVESMWGNTDAIGVAVGAGIGPGAEVLRIDGAPEALPADLDLLVVGGPTHAFSMSRADTRKTAREQGASRVPKLGIREWIGKLGTPPRGTRVATFDTRSVNPRLPGSAAKKAMKRLVRIGFEPIAAAESFGVYGYDGPLEEGEVARAEQWGRTLAGRLA